MHLTLGHSRSVSPRLPCAATIGNFDGVHTGHLQILRELRRAADSRSLPAVLIAFEPQPQEFFARRRNAAVPLRLTPLREKLAVLRRSGLLDEVCIWRFDAALADMSAECFVRLLAERANVRYLLVGDDFRFGRGRSGDFAFLQQYAVFESRAMPSLKTGDLRTSSTAVREALRQGRLDFAETLLGRPYSLGGRVMHGAKLGRQLGCPTANICLPPHRYPLAGIFAVRVEGVFGCRYGVASFGTNPTVSDSPRQKLEVHIFDFDGDLYGQRLQVVFLHKLRDERHFADLAALQAQIACDMAEARCLLGL